MRPKNQKTFNQACTHLEVKRQKSSKDKRSSHTPLNSFFQNSQLEVFALIVLKSMKFINCCFMVGWRNAKLCTFFLLLFLYKMLGFLILAWGVLHKNPSFVYDINETQHLIVCDPPSRILTLMCSTKEFYKLQFEC